MHRVSCKPDRDRRRAEIDSGREGEPQTRLADHEQRIAEHAERVRRELDGKLEPRTPEQKARHSANMKAARAAARAAGRVRKARKDSKRAVPGKPPERPT